jgi:hypothetical protein
MRSVVRATVLSVLLSLLVAGGLFAPVPLSLAADGTAAAPAAPGDVFARAVTALDGLDPALLGSGRLYDRALPMSTLARQDGSGQGPAAGAADWRQMLHELRRASLTPPAGWPTPDEAREAARQAQAAGVIPLGLLDAGYDRLRPDALERGLVAWDADRLVVTAAGRAASPFSAHRAFAAAALLPRTYHGADVTFTLPAALVAADGPRPLRLRLDAGDGRGWRDVTVGGALHASYTATGPVTLRLGAEYPDGTRREAALAFEVAALAAPAPTATWPITATVPYQGVYGYGDAYVYLAPGHATVTEPVVVVEGFDLDNTMNWDELYALLNQENMLEEMRAAGFDAVVLNFHDSTDDIRRNAMTLVELLRQVGVAQPDGRDRIVIGASMGGLVARYALAWMEQHGQDPNARTFISFDSPQLGANIPLGVQYWLQLFQIESTDAGYLLSRLDTPAAREMLLYHHTVPATATGQADPLRAAFLADLAAVGSWPTGLRKVAIANGSGQAVGQGYNPGAQLISYEYYSFLVDLIGNVWATPNGGPQQILRGLIDRIWPLSDDQLNVTISGAQPWDSAPGGWRASLADMDATPAPYGDIVALYPNHCFIPTISALALDVAAPYTNVSTLADPLSHTPFDAIYWPAANQEHVLVTPENKVWFNGEIARANSAVGDDLAAAPRARLLGAQPNPFNPRTSLVLDLPAAVPSAQLAIFDLAGHRVRTLLQGPLPVGRQTVAWDGRDDAGRALPSGAYVGRLETGDAASTARLQLVR